MHPLADRGDGLEEFLGVFDGHIEHIGDAEALEFNLERLAVIPAAIAFLARDVNIGEEVHLDLDQAVAVAGFAAAPFDIEAEPAGFIAARSGFGQAGEPIADQREAAGVGCGV